VAAAAGSALLVSRLYKAVKRPDRQKASEYPLKLTLDRSLDITTSEPEAKAWFNLGTAWLFALNYAEEAKYCFEQALLWDRSCAMAHWGVAFSIKPSYNRSGPYDYYANNLGQHELARMHLAESKAQFESISTLERDIIKPLLTFFDPAVIGTEEGTMTQRMKRRLEQLPGIWKSKLVMPAAPRGLAALFPAYSTLGKRLSGCDAFVTVYADREQSYFEEMLDTHRKYEAVGAMPAMIPFVTVEAGMVLGPWSMHWPEAAEVKKVLEPVIHKATLDHPSHPGLHHLNIHFQELGPNPELAQASALALARGVGGSDNGHLWHMAGHILAQLGQHNESMHANIKAREADLKYTQQRPDTAASTKFMTLHNMTFVVWGAMHSGQKALCLRYARELMDEAQKSFTPFRIMNHVPNFEGVYDFFFMMFVPYYYYAHIRFGMWKEILAMPVPSEAFDIHHAVVRYARGVAFAATNRVEEAENELRCFKHVVTEEKFRGRQYVLAWGETLDVLRVDQAWLEGEIAYRKKDYSTAFSKLREAVAKADALPYMEAPPFPIPPRHALAALLMETKQLKEAAEVYREELAHTEDPRRRHPNSIWVLAGLLQCLKGLDDADPDEMDEISKRLELAKQYAPDFTAKTSCACAVELFA